MNLILAATKAREYLQRNAPLTEEVTTIVAELDAGVIEAEQMIGRIKLHVHNQAVIASAESRAKEYKSCDNCGKRMTTRCDEFKQFNRRPPDDGWCAGWERKRG
ncbi:MAG: hypothetical protein ABFD75_12065 [Smithella sp.]